MSLELAILGFLSQRPRSGYELKKQCFSGPVSGFWTADQAQIYRTLERLNKAGLVSATRRRQAKRPDRRLFDITQAGRDVFAGMLGETKPLTPLRDGFLVQLYFSSTLTDEALLQILRSQRTAHQQRLQNLRDRSSHLAQETGLSPRAAILRQTALDGAIERERSLVDWLDDCIEAVVSEALPEMGESIGQRHLLGG